MREYLPSTTGIGSVPHTEIKKSLSLVTSSVLIPFWTQHPKRSPFEMMIPQYSENLPYLTVEGGGKRIFLTNPEKDSYKQLERFYEASLKDDYIEKLGSISEEYARGLYAFLKWLKSLKKRLPLIKIHTTGPFTFTLGLNFEDNSPIYSDNQIREAAFTLLKAKSLWQIKTFKPYCKDCILFLDEPILAAIGSYPMLTDEVVVETLRNFIKAIKDEENEILVGVHCCGNTDWSLLVRSGINIISFDAYFYGDTLLLYADHLREFVENGGILAFGIIPTDGDKTVTETYGSLEERLEGLVQKLSAKGVNLPRDQILVTPSCGTGSLSVPAAETVFRLLSSFSHEFANR